VLTSVAVVTGRLGADAMVLVVGNASSIVRACGIDFHAGCLFAGPGGAGLAAARTRNQ
jgi:hypothetical protein